ncbi:MAG: isoleucine--tRNA ligase [Flavobacteriales bacterium MED-G22]|nr:MAG: isoleucine--tRNA ligase [Flavobacteriales bacterium MED-G22]
MKYTEYDSLDLPAIANRIETFWKTDNTFSKSISQREGAPPFVFYEGPPSANGKPGIHHVMARSIKDIFCRYKTQKGFQVHRKAGWDTHGLPVELGVEKELGITKEDIGKSISVSDYNEACKKAVMKYTDLWNQLTQKMGYWVDMENPYVTYTSKYIESVWWLLKQIHEKGMLYKGYTIQPYSPIAGTGLSSHELNQPGTYKDVTDTTITAQFKTLKESLPKTFQKEIPLYILAWTTTPWTLPSNTALTVGKKIDYVILHTFNQYTFEPIRVLLADALLSKQLGKKYKVVAEEKNLKSYKGGDKKIPYYIEAHCKGIDLIGIRYEQLWDEAPLPMHHPENAFRIISGDFVTTNEGTGIVHTAPTFGADDALVAKEAIPEVPALVVEDENGHAVPLVDLKGRFRKEMGRLANKFVKNQYYPEGEAPDKSVDVEIAIHLKEMNSAFKVEKYVHSYPNCWRTDKPILYYPLDSWFIKVSDVKERMFELNKTINWKPKATGEGRFGNWLAQANDWNLSRSRFWGIPLPVWRTESGDETKVIGSLEELIGEIKSAIEQGLMRENPFEKFKVGDNDTSNYEQIDLHKNTVDQIILSSSTGHPMRRETDLIDVWFDSGAMPYAQWHYPFENKDKIDNNRRFPADYIAEGVDQTRGWFYTLHAIGTLVFDQIAYKNVVSNGLVLDKSGQKMSKRLGNAIDPFDTLKHYGPDATRWYMISNANPWDNLKFDVEGIGEVRRKFFGTLYNTYSFFSMYANIDYFVNQEKAIPFKNRSELDQWILSELNSLILYVAGSYDDYEPTRASRAISEFVQEKLSNWYVRLNRRRFWKGEYGQDKLAAYQTLHKCLVVVSQLAAPIAPFYMDQLYQDLNLEKQSVHLSQFPRANKEQINAALEAQINMARNLTSLALSLRKKAQIKVRQPLQKLVVPVKNMQERAMVKKVEEQLKLEINVKEIEVLDNADSLLVKEIKPNFKVLGPKYGKSMSIVAQRIKTLNPEQIKTLEEKKSVSIQLNEKNITLELADVEIYFKDIQGWQVAQGHGLSVALDVTLNDTLIQEGVSRELVNRIQNLRKEHGFEITDTIGIELELQPELQVAVEQNKDYVLTETLGVTLDFISKIEKGTIIEFDNIKTKINIQKIES